MNTRSKVLLGLAAVGVGVGALAATGAVPVLKRPAPAEAAKKAPPTEAVFAPTVTVARAAPQRFVETLTVTGTLVPRDEVLVGPEVEGLRITEVLADEGQAVKKGDVMARLVFETLEAQLAANSAGIARATAAIAQATSNIAASEARMTETKNAWDRAKPLKQNGYVSEAVYEQRESAYKTAVANLAVSRDQLKAAEAEKVQLEAQRREISWRRGKTEIVAPVDGIVSRKTARIGSFAAGAGDALFRIVARGELELEADITEQRMPRMKEGLKALIDVPGLDDVPGTVRLVSAEIDRASRLGKIRVFIGNDPRLRIGTFARATIDTANSNGLGIPTSAVQNTETGAFVQVVENGKVKTQRVKLGLVANGFVEITDGLKDGDLVVAKAGTFLREGDSVTPMETKAQASATTGSTTGVK
jgi:HlyD family secretion protein